MQGKVPSSPKLFGEKERINGGGDGIRPQNVTARKRVPVSSARKFNARAPREEGMQLKLEVALNEVLLKKKLPKESQKLTMKSASMAEITPTKTKRRLSAVSASGEGDSCELYATPRPFRDTPKRNLCLRERNSCQLYRRLMLLAWRTSRAKRKEADGLVKKQLLQIIQLEMQVDVLSKLRVSESQKREQIQVDCQKLRKSIETLELDNGQLNEETQSLQHTLDVVQNELKVAKAENNFLSEQSMKMQDIIAKKKSEKMALEEKVRLHQTELSSQKSLASSLEADLQTASKNLKVSEQNYRIKEKKYAQLKCEFKKQLDANKAVTGQLQSLQEEKLDVSLKLQALEDQLNEYVGSCEVLRESNDALQRDIHDVSLELLEEKKRTWLKNTRDFALLSLNALQKVARKAIPAYLDGPTNF